MIQLSFTAGAVFVGLCLVLSFYFGEAEALVVPRQVLPPWVHTLAEHGRVRAVRVRSIPTPEAAAVFAFGRKIIAKYVDDVARWVMSSVTDPEFSEWWEETWTSERKRMYHGRRRYEEVSLRTEWRSRWAAYDTQSWPTLATSGNAWELVPTLTIMDEKVPTICTGMTFNTMLAVIPVEHVARNLSENPRLLHAV